MEFTYRDDGSGGRSVSNGGGRWRVSRGTEYSMWRRAGCLMLVPVKDRGHVPAEWPRRCSGRCPQNSGVPYYVSDDGQRIIAIAAIEGSAKPVLTAIINWPALLQK